MLVATAKLAGGSSGMVLLARIVLPGESII